jgi:hypothetical protein
VEFSAIGLTALIPDAQGGVNSEGLAFFIDQEIAVAPAEGVSAADNAKLAARLIHELVDGGALSTPTRLSGISEHHGDRIRALRDPRNVARRRARDRGKGQRDQRLCRRVEIVLRRTGLCP